MAASPGKRGTAPENAAGKDYRNMLSIMAWGLGTVVVTQDLQRLLAKVH